MEHLVDGKSVGEIEVLGENLAPRQFVHYEPHMTWNRPRAAKVRSQRLTA
jgi:hypothetical protein